MQYIVWRMRILGGMINSILAEAVALVKTRGMVEGTLRQARSRVRVGGIPHEFDSRLAS